MKALAALKLWLLMASALAGQTRPQPIPDPEAIAKAKMLIADVYRKDYEKAKTADQRRALAAKIFDDARQSRDDLPGRYALLQVAADIAVNARDTELVLAIIDQGSSDFAIDRLAWADELLRKIGDEARPAKDPASLLGGLLQLATQALQQDQFDIAQRIGKLAAQFSRKVNDRALATELQSRLKDIEELERRYERIKPAIEKLTTDPADAIANQAVGEFRCFHQLRWDEGLPMLALGDDPALAALAAKEIAQPQSGAELLSLADDWWERAQSDKQHAKVLQRHALDRYLQALPKLEGLPRKRAEARLAAAERWLSKEAVYFTSEPNKDQPPLPSFLNESEKYYDPGGKPHAFHMNGNTVVMIDLKREVSISRIYIANRQINDRTRGMRMHLSATAADRGPVVWTAPDNAAEWNIQLPKIYTARYITLVLDARNDAFFHLKKLKAFGPE